MIIFKLGALPIQNWKVMEYDHPFFDIIPPTHKMLAQSVSVRSAIYPYIVPIDHSWNKVWFIGSASLWSYNHPEIIMSIYNWFMVINLYLQRIHIEYLKVYWFSSTGYQLCHRKDGSWQAFG